MNKKQNNTEQEKIQWHPAFVSAINLELAQDRQYLLFEKEYNLNTKPLEIDLLIIKKETNTQLHNEIGRFFRFYNILEFKSPGYKTRRIVPVFCTSRNHHRPSL